MGDQIDREFELESSPTWLLLFGDVAPLLLAFFVMLFAMSSVQSEKWDSVVAMLSTRVTPKDRILRPTATSEYNIATVELDTALPLEYLENVLQEKLQRDEVLSRAVLNRQDLQIVISLPSDSLFEPGQAETTQPAREALFRMGAVLSTIGNQIDIRGHTGREQVGRQLVPVELGAVTCARRFCRQRASKHGLYPSDYRPGSRRLAFRAHLA